MEITTSEIKNRLTEKGLKVTPQRMVILEAVYNLNNHLTADIIIEYIRLKHPGIATGTVYKILETLVLNEHLKTNKNGRKSSICNATYWRQST